jgi:hypothetical protein
MYEYWESRFRNEGAMWKTEPADSALSALALFKKEKINKILIPGFGYGRNGGLFTSHGFDVTGIEISQSAIDLARKNEISCRIHHGSVTSMPFDHDIYEGIYCYALIHLLNSNERKEFLYSCFNQLAANGIMIFITTSKLTPLFGKGRFISTDRYQIAKGLRVFFYDQESIAREFSGYGLIESKIIEEPVKFMEGEEPLQLISVICRKPV